MFAVFGAACGTFNVTEQPVSETTVANEGYDSVAYFAADKALKGNPEFSFVFKGAKWIFSSRENLEKFRVEPEKYIPQFGSHCPVSLASGAKEKGDPSVWTVVNDKLYFFYSEGHKKEFERDRERVLSKAMEKHKP